MLTCVKLSDINSSCRPYLTSYLAAYVVITAFFLSNIDGLPWHHKYGQTDPIPPIMINEHTSFMQASFYLL